MNIIPYSISDLTRSGTAQKRGINNTPPPQIQSCLMDLINYILNPLAKAYGKRFTITNGYRCARLNNAVGGAKSSQHLLGQAADITGGNANENKRLMLGIIWLKLPYDQLIWEYGGRWVHVSYGPKNRRQVLKVG